MELCIWKHSEPSHIHQSLQYWFETKDVEFRGSKNGCSLQEIQMVIKHCGYDIMVFPSISIYTELYTFVTELELPMLASLELDFCSITHRNVIGILPYMSSETSHVEYHIIDGAHPEMKPMHFNQKNID